MMFMITNPSMAKKSYCGVLDFTACEGTCHLPDWMIKNLCLDDGSEVIIRSISLKKCTYIKLQPHSKTFTNLSSEAIAIIYREL